MAFEHQGFDLPLSFSRPQQSFRLLELTPDLLQLVTSENPPTLTLKAAPTSISSTGTSLTPHAVLCTPNETYRLRQVHSSNNLFLIKPTTLDHNEVRKDLGVSVIATARSTLEVQRISDSATSHLCQLLQVYDGPESPSRVVSPTISSPIETVGKTKQEVVASIPLSDGECEQSWLELCAFEHKGIAVRPSVTALIGVWRALFSAAVSERIDLGVAFQTDDLWKLIVDDEYPRPFFQAILNRLAADGHTRERGWAAVDRNRLISWLGAIVLLSHEEAALTDLTLSEFLASWKADVPESWSEAISLKALECQYFRPTPATIRYGMRTTESSGLESSLIKSTASDGQGKRKWHDKFRSAPKS